MKRKLIEKRITVGFSQSEIEQLDTYCKLAGRTYTDVIRECIRNLVITSPKSSVNKAK
ncbi:CopG family transcriptional regulator [Candidatus Gracilibacteria bacterium]|nr:CopG family transcriptional regulator [Candidatus Gracilibacteria bacterium]NJM85838.1 CopG family transcriptional regulator [Hydrococcus sp. RU_2_2]NJP17902.1 CopG family transcriptional regulator [Hydrococcus sp. CRU_1_1]